MLFLQRSGYTEETFHTFSYSPIFDDRGAVDGMLCVVTEDTEDFIAHRRMQTLRDLGSRRTSNLTVAETISIACRELARQPAGPAVLAGLPLRRGRVPPRASSAPPASTASIPRLPPSFAVGDDAARCGPPPPRSRRRDRARRQPRRAVPRPADRAWDVPPRDALVVPLVASAQAPPYGFQVFGLNRYRPYRRGYRDFCDLVAGQLAASITDARAYEFEKATGRDAGRARPGQDRLLHQREPRVPHPAHAPARAGRGRPPRRGDSARRASSESASR